MANIYEHTHLNITSSLHIRANARGNAGCQAGRDSEDAHPTHAHTCSHTHGDAHCGAYHGGPGSGDTWEDPAADAKAASGDSEEKQRREGKSWASLISSLSLSPFFCVTFSPPDTLSVCKWDLNGSLANPGDSNRGLEEGE